MLDRDTFSHKNAKKLLENLVLVRIDVDDDEKTPVEFKVEALPTVVFVSSDGTEISRFEGYVAFEEFAAKVKEAMEKAAPKKAE